MRLCPLILLAACSTGPSTPEAAPKGEKSAENAPSPDAGAGADKDADGRKRAPGKKILERNGGTLRPRAALPADAPELGEQYLVILASKLDPEEAKPAIEAVKAHAEIAAKPKLLLSSRYKALMPCYTVAIADAFADKKAAFALSKQLTAAGVDNYVKNAGAYVGVSPTLDSFCEGASASQTASDSARALRTVAGKLWMPTGEEIPPNLRLAAPKRMDDTYGAWIQALGNPSPSPWRALNVSSGEGHDCKTDQEGILTLGTPHFGLLQGEDKPTEPSCGTAERYAELDCAATDGAWIAVPTSAKPAVYKPSPAPALEAAATSELSGQAAWSAAAVLEGEAAPTRKVTVTRYVGPGGTFFLVEGQAEAGEGVCGGDEVTLRALYASDGQGLGRRLGPFQEAHFSTLLGVVDVEGDGAPELYWSAFPDSLTLARANGDIVFEHEVAYCDCPC